MKRCLAILVIFALTTAAHAASLKNDGFESGDFSPWQAAGEGWRTSAFEADVHKGKMGIVNDIVVGGGDEYRVIYQEIKTQGGKRYEAEAWVRAVCIEGSEAFLEIQFMDKAGTVLKQYQSEKINHDQDFTLLKIESMEAPREAYKVSIRGVVHVNTPPEINPDYHIFDEFKFRRAKK